MVATFRSRSAMFQSTSDAGFFRLPWIERGIPYAGSGGSRRRNVVLMARFNQTSSASAAAVKPFRLSLSPD
jgi:hypothetical protein